MKAVDFLTRVMIVVLSSLMVACIGLSLIARRSGPPGEITDLTRYEEIRESYEDSILVRHFPEEVPENATNAEMYYLPKFLQGGEQFQLRLQLPEREVTELHARFDALAGKRYAGGENVYWEPEVPRLHVGGSKDSSWPGSYEILVLDAQPAGSAESEWNHGYSYGVGVDKSALEVVYWCEFW